MKKAKVITFTGINKVEMLEYDIPSPGAGELLVETDYTIVSAGTERAVLTYAPNTVRTYPVVLGYSGSGHVIGVGEGVTEFAVGDRVLCDHLGHRSHSIAKANDTVKILHENVSSLDAATVIIGSMGVQGLRKGLPELGNSIMVMGCGILGQYAIGCAKYYGGLPVIACDLDPFRRETALKMGADYALCPTDADFKERIEKITDGKMVDLTVEVSGAESALNQALEVAAWEGKITLTGCTREYKNPIDFYSKVHKPGISLIGAHNFVRPKVDSYDGYWTRHDDFRCLLKMLSVGRLNVSPIINEVVSPNAFADVYDRLIVGTGFPLGVIFDWSKL